jgi:hypothetical protein
MNPAKSIIEKTSVAAGEMAGQKRKRQGVAPAERPAEMAHLKLFLRHACRQCSETAVAEEVRQLHHVRRVETHPERHEIEIWTGFPAPGLMREIVGVVKSFCCEMTACHVR